MQRRIHAIFPVVCLLRVRSDDHIPSLDIGWSHHGPLAAYDAKSVRRGFQVGPQLTPFFFCRERA